jgi:glycosyltransferase involved in cell wall biosynthesis
MQLVASDSTQLHTPGDLAAVQMNRTNTLSIVAPVFNEANLIREFITRLTAITSQLADRFRIEIVLIDDGSRDGTLQIMKSLVAEHPELKIVELRSNSGQTAALQAGIDVASGNIVITMDSDLQHFPEDIPIFLDKIDEGWDVVCGWRHDRQEGLDRRLPSRAANWLLRQISGLTIHDIGTTFRAYRGEIVRDIRLLGESHRFVPIYASAVGAKITEVPIQNIEREKGTSNYGLMRTFNVLFDLFFLYFYANFRDRPIRIFGWLSLVFWLAGGAIAAILMAVNLVYGVPVVHEHSGWFVLSVMLILFGLLFILSGVTLEMIVRIYYSDRSRSQYRVRKIWTTDDFHGQR